MGEESEILDPKEKLLGVSEKSTNTSTQLVESGIEPSGQIGGKWVLSNQRQAVSLIELLPTLNSWTKTERIWNADSLFTG